MSPTTVDDLRLFRFVVKIETEDAGAFRGSGFLAAPGFVLTCAHVVDGIEDGAGVRVVGAEGLGELRGVVRARAPRRAGRDGLWAWPDLAIVELIDEDGRFTDHPCPRIDLVADPPSDPVRRRAVVAARPDPGNPESRLRTRGVDFTWESVDDQGFWWLTGGQALRGMSGSMLVDTDRGAIVGVVDNTRGAGGAVATPLSALVDTGLPEAFAAAAGELVAASGVAGTADWDGAFTRRLDFAWRDYWAPETAGAHFVGRAWELEKLKADLDESGGLAVVQSLGGFGGVGKTALSVAFGNRYRDRFSGGRVFHDFRSYRGSRSDTAADALGSVLKAVGAATVDELARLGHRERADLWQAVASGRRLLMVWDNVDGVEQLDGLIVHGDGCATVVTSRDIIRIEGAKPLRLDVLDEADAVAMFTAIAGDHPPELVAELVRRDLYVPVLISTHAEEVANEEIALEEIIEDLPDPSAARHAPRPDYQKDLFDRLAGSYRRLDEQARLAFRVLGAHPGYSATAESLAAAMGCELAEGERRLRRLVKAGLAERHFTEAGKRDRRLRAYKAHDLIRAYGAHLAEHATAVGDDGEPIDERLHSQLALMGYFVDQLTGETFTNKKDWFGIESDSIRDLALSGTSDAHARLARFIGYRALVFCRYDVAEVAFRHAKTLAERAGDTQRVAHMLWGLGEVGRLTGDLSEAADRYRGALAASRAAEDPGGIGNAERGLGEVAQLMGDADGAEAHYLRAMDAYREIGDRRRIAYVQRGLARVAELRGDYALAEEHFAAALGSSRAENDEIGVAYAQRGTAEVLLAAGETERAAEQYLAAEATFDVVGSPVGAATAWHGLGRVALARGDSAEAVSRFERAADVYEEHGETVAFEEVVAELRRLREAD